MSRSFALLVANVCLAWALISCGGSAPALPRASVAARDTSALDSRLQGSWRLVEYRPEVPPDPMFQSLLATQVGILVVRFDRGTLHADSPTLHLTRPYRVVDAKGPLFTVESPDAGGAVFTTAATISDDDRRIDFRGDTEPWRGSGALVRLP
jgi:hypothetical protein